MKKALKIFVVILIAVAILYCGISINSRTFSKQFKDESFEIFIPSGVADKYKDTMVMSFDDGRLWIYSLNEKEITLMEKDLGNGKWTPFESGNHNWFFRVVDTEEPTGKAYEFTYDLGGGHRLLFVYDTENYCYYCISASV